MKFISASLLCSILPAAAFQPASTNSGWTLGASRTAAEELAGVELARFRAEDLAGVVAPLGFFDPAGFSDKADEATMKRYREAELTHGRVAMLATVGFLAGEAVESKTFIFNGEVTGPAITHLAQVNPVFWALLGAGIGASEFQRAKIGFVEPENVPYDQPGQLREKYIPGDIGFDPLSLMPTTEKELMEMQTKELQNGRLAMIAAAGFLAQELVDGKGILEHIFA
eukprot:CAMPEP_0195288106 /NCGR_PEP_ID=MMETSP0707-20130614/4902_1 /TAXON_ID=33640 /ORGANISM="Asterionellopsis glacialis, Strain CCMP134" /LENGTH=225 /DNA_ID=CAMNT_0040347931 /DNA_START=59 /DNA_END=736 /DNA_ORIENTATION=+